MTVALDALQRRRLRWRARRGLLENDIVLTAIGGKRGGGAAVTPFGLRLVRLFRDMESKASTSIAADLKRFEKYLR